MNISMLGRRLARRATLGRSWRADACVTRVHRPMAQRRLLSSDQKGGNGEADDTPGALLPVACTAMAGCVALSNYLVQFPVGWIGTWGTAVFPACFLITDLTNRLAGAAAARRVVYTGFAVGVPASLLVLPDEPRIACASGAAFLASQLLDVAIFDALRGHRVWWVAPLCSSVTSSAFDSALFGTIAFLGTEMPTEAWPLAGDVPHWVTWGFGDFFVKSTFAVLNLLPFRFLSRARHDPHARPAAATRANSQTTHDEHARPDRRTEQTPSK